ncbi:MAG: alpha/beta fold hydrolase [Gammaproteobacteria bacterium]
MGETLYHTTIQTNGVNLQVVQAGPRDGKLIIFLHGYPEFWGIWRTQIDFFAQQGYCVWAPDQRGYATSDKPRAIDAYALDHLAEDIVGLIDAAEREKAVVIAHDWGGMVNFWLGMKHATRLERLAVFNAPHPKVFLDQFKTNEHLKKAAGYVNFFQWRWLPEIVLSLFAYAIPANTMRDTGNPGTFTPEVLAEYKTQWKQAGAFHAMLNWYRALFQTPSPNPASFRVTVPMLLVWGQRDKWMLTDLAKPSIDLCDEGTLQVWDDSSHWSVQEFPERVNTTLAEFLGI